MFVKRCTKCGKVKTLDCFYKGHAKYQKTSWCKECIAKYKKEYQVKNETKIKLSGKQYRKRNRNKIARKHKEWSSKNVDFWTINNPYDNRTLKKCAGCGKLQPRINFCKHRARKDGLRSYCKRCLAGIALFRRHGITLEEKREIYKEQSKKCFICLRSMNINSLHIDHRHETKEETMPERAKLNPKAKRKTVRALLCRSCNSHLLSWLKEVNFGEKEALIALKRAYKCIADLPAQKLLNKSIT